MTFMFVVLTAWCHRSCYERSSCANYVSTVVWTPIVLLSTAPEDAMHLILSPSCKGGKFRRWVGGIALQLDWGKGSLRYHSNQRIVNATFKLTAICKTIYTTIAKTARKHNILNVTAHQEPPMSLPPGQVHTLSAKFWDGLGLGRVLNSCCELTIGFEPTWRYIYCFSKWSRCLHEFMFTVWLVFSSAPPTARYFVMKGPACYKHVLSDIFLSTWYRNHDWIPNLFPTKKLY